jgi:hypothetical protein
MNNPYEDSSLQERHSLIFGITLAWAKCELGQYQESFMLCEEMI